MWKMSIEYTVLGFKPTTFWTWVSPITTRPVVNVAILPNVLNHHSLVSKPLWHSFLQSWISTINTFISSSLRRASTWPRIARSCQTTTISSSTCSSRKRLTLNFELMTKRPSLRRYFEARLLETEHSLKISFNSDFSSIIFVVNSIYICNLKIMTN